MIESKIKEAIEKSIYLKTQLLKSEQSISFITQVSKIIYSKIMAGGKLLICGNGGSAADSQHIAAELVGRFLRDRKALPAIALTTDTSVLTAISNDYNFDIVFERQIEALCTSYDICWGISTSGNSSNVLKALFRAREKGAYTIALLGGNGGKCANYADRSYIVPSIESARIQEIHLLIEHLICELVEYYYVSNEK
ncbi:Phosphoheptose isomerase 1 [termite gut metagenome]|uniref:D-sedoheptulose-7-phosphate isomerase n=1 Tax=termite gut metagenome TaxID=433724 RepID=A0A5J4SW63_9ZZZZ